MPEPATQVRKPLTTTPASQQPGPKQHDNGDDRGDGDREDQPTLPGTGMPSRAGPITSKPPLALSSVRAFGMGRPFLLILGHGLSPYSVTATASVARLWWNRQATSDLDHFSIVLLVQTIADAIRPMSFSIAALDDALGVR